MNNNSQETLPTGWIECSVGDITLPVSKIDPRENEDREIAYVDISSIDNEKNVIGIPKKYRLGEAPSRARQIIHAGDVLFSTVRPYLRNIAPVHDILHEQVASTGFSVLRPASGINPLFLFYKVISADFVDSLSGKQYGVSYPAVRDDQVRDQLLLLPPSPEQRRIVAKIEELFSELDTGIKNLRATRQQLSAYREALLNKAFQGKLTARCRAENQHKLLSPEQLLEIVKRERNTHYEQQLSEWREAVREWQKNGENGKKPSKPSPLKIFPPLDANSMDLPELPRGWAWDRLGWMTCGVEYGTSTKSSKTGMVPVLRMGNIQNAKLDWSELVYTSDDDEIRRYSLNEGDVLFNRTNSPELVGKTAIYRGGRKAIFAGYLILINHIRSIIDSQYLNFFLNSPIARHHANAVKTDGVNQSNINGRRLSHYPFPYCPLAEQREITSILEERLSLVDEVEAEIDMQLKKAEALRQSILNKAFEGNLVPQDPSDEPASALLKRIEAERAARNNTTMQRKTGT